MQIGELLGKNLRKRIYPGTKTGQQYPKEIENRVPCIRMHREFELETRQYALVITRANIPVARGIDQNIPNVGETKQHLQRKLGVTMKKDSRHQGY